VTFFGIFLTPVFYYSIQWFSERRTAAKAVTATVAATPPTAAATPHQSPLPPGEG
jgi:hypothetical protein